MELRRYLAILRRRWYIFVLGLLVGIIGGYTFSKLQKPIYRAQATLLLNLAAQPAVPTLSDVSASQALTKTYAKIVSARPTLEETARRLGGNVTASQLSGVSGSDSPQTELIVASFESRDPAFAARVVNTVSEVFASRVREAQLGGSPVQGGTQAAPGNLNTVYIVEPAVQPTSPISPRTTLNTVLAGAMGLLVAIGVVAVLEYLDDTIKTPADLEQLDLTLMGAVQRFPRRRDTAINVLEEGSRRYGLQEAYQQLRTNVEFAALDGDIRSLVVTSAQPGEGKTTTAVNLAIMTARGGKRVILVDTDLRRPSVHHHLKMNNYQGVTTALLSGSNELPPSVLQSTDIANLHVVTSGPLPPNPAEVLNSKKMLPFMLQLQDRADLVIYDTPPSVAVADAAILAAHADAVLLVVDTGRTRVAPLRTGLDHIVRSRTRILGAVLNKVSRHGRGYQSYYYYYSSHYGIEPPPIGRNGSHADEQPVRSD